jgi:Na+-transporting methylmalonyl-CoA/oxaloacetate decarboxylase gamma subunit
MTDSVRVPPPADQQLPPVKSDSSDDMEQFLRTVALDVVDKQYRLYAWNDAKTQALITTNSLLFAAVGFLFKECLKDTLAIWLLGLAIFFLTYSLIISLKQVIPRISSGKTDEGPNIRSLRGISLFKKWNDYYNAFILTTKSTILTDTIRQIYGMADNNLRSARIITKGVYLTTGGVIMIFLAICASAFAVRGHHILGVWQVEGAEVVGRLNVSPSNVVAQTSVPTISASALTNPATTVPTQAPPMSAVSPTSLTNNKNSGTTP